MEDFARVLVAGDWHGNTDWMQRCVRIAQSCGLPAIVQVGDCGVWPGSRNGIDKFLYNVNQAAARAGIQVLFVDGNHDYHPWILAQPLAEDGSRPLGTHVTHLPRGFRWTWAGRRFLAMGGAVSTDRDGSDGRNDWWREEAISQADLYRTLGGGPADVVISHDAPYGTVGLTSERLDHAASTVNRQMLATVVQDAQAALVIHGHYHQRYSGTVAYEGGEARVEGLARDYDAKEAISGRRVPGGFDAIAILDVETLRVLPVTA